VPAVVEKSDPREPADHALGRSRGGFSTKIHLLCDAHGLPLHFELTPGQANESTAFDTVLVGADATRFDVGGHRLPWPKQLGGDRAYRANWIDEYLAGLEIEPVIPSRETEHRELRPAFDKDAYRRRNIVERLIGWLKESRRIFSRFEKTAINFAGMIKLGCIRQYLSYDVDWEF
jgi:transposase